jgi:hypothetical protein
LRGIYLLLAEHGGALFDYFADFYTTSRLGRPTVPARVLATVMILQSHEDLSDQEACDRLERNLAWLSRAGEFSPGTDMSGATGGRCGARRGRSSGAAARPAARRSCEPRASGPIWAMNAKRARLETRPTRTAVVAPPRRAPRVNMSAIRSTPRRPPSVRAASSLRPDARR